MLKVVYKYLSDNLPNVFDNFYVKTTEVHSYGTRQYNNLYLPRCRIDVTKHTVKYSGCSQWNALSNELKAFTGTLKTFKNKIIHSWFPE